MLKRIVLALAFVGLASCAGFLGGGSYTRTVTVAPGQWLSTSHSVSGTTNMSAKFTVQGGLVSAYFLTADEFARWKAGANAASIRTIHSAVNTTSGHIGGTVPAGTYVFALYNPSGAAVSVTYRAYMGPVSGSK